MIRFALLIAGILGSLNGIQAQPAARAAIPLPARAAATLAQHEGKLTTMGLEAPVEVLRDKWGIPHIYAKTTHDLFFAQGFVAAQDHMWQMELWRRNNEGRLAEGLGAEYLQRDQFARTIAFHGDWNVEMRKYHPEGPVIFQAFADGVNRAIHLALEEGKVPVEFPLMGFLPEASWTAQAVLSRMPGWTLSGNAHRELARAIAIKAMGVEKAQQAILTDPYKAIQVPPGLDLDTLSAHAMELARNANDFWWRFGPGLTPPPAAL